VVKNFQKSGFICIFLSFVSASNLQNCVKLWIAGLCLSRFLCQARLRGRTRRLMLYPTFREMGV